MRRLLPLIRPVALAAFALATIMAGLRWHGTDRFRAEAMRTEGTVLAVGGNGRTTIGFSPAPGQQERFTTSDAANVAEGAPVPVAYLKLPGEPTTARLATPHALWAGMWAWVEVALAAGLAAVYGRALVEDPLSVIGFKSWRSLDRPRRH